jgi:membrane protein DedA with SNARE-associated domain
VLRRLARVEVVAIFGISLEHLVSTIGLPLLFVLVLLESAGIPLPGETALVTASVIAARGKLNIVEVIVVASAAAILGDNGGYWVGRHWGRQLLTRWARLERFSQRVLPPSERFFAKHGDKTVFIGRFVAILRFTAAWMAGVAHMPWWRFLVFNAAGGICWATLVALLAYYLGRTAGEALNQYGLLGAGALIGAIGIVLFGVHVLRRRVAPEES